MKSPLQLDLFAGPAPLGPRSRSALALDGLSGAEVIAAMEDAALADARALAAEAGGRRLAGAVPALEALLRRFAGYGLDRIVPEQAAALDALATIGGASAAAAVNRAIRKGYVTGPTLAAAANAAARLRVALPPGVLLAWLRHAEPPVRAAACACARPGSEAVAILTSLLADLDREVAISAACALGRMGRVEARTALTRALSERPSPRVIDAASGVANDEIVTRLARLGHERPEFAGAVLAALDELDMPRATMVASALRGRLSQASPG